MDVQLFSQRLARNCNISAVHEMTSRVRLENNFMTVERFASVEQNFN